MEILTDMSENKTDLLVNVEIEPAVQGLDLNKDAKIIKIGSQQICDTNLEGKSRTVTS